jgi:porphobilinogen deaminase
MSSPRTTFTIGTRKSKLALLQTDIVRAALQEAWPDYEFKVHTRDAAGDLNKVTPLREFTAKNLWTEELEELLIANQIDLVVHSLKGTVQTEYHCIFLQVLTSPRSQMSLLRFLRHACSARLCLAKTREMYSS